jgi:predicted methyltransferase
MRVRLVALAIFSLIALQATAAHHETTSDLAGVLAAQPDDVKARYEYRHPQETLEFFDIQPGMTVLETLPGGGWYSKVLLPYLGADGHLIGANYAQEIWPLFGFFSEERIEEMKTWVTDWPVEAEEWRDENSASVSAFILGSIPDDVKGTADRAVIVRTLHNLTRFNGQGGFLDSSIADVFAALKPGGLAGVVQHEARDDRPDEWADGSRGYIKKSFVIEQMENAGFEYVGEIDVNQNPSDQPGDADIVWRLPPTMMGSQDNPEQAAAVTAIGESNRMTLKFRKPE